MTSTRQVRKPPVSFATRENLLRCVSSVEQPLHRVRLHSSTLALREIDDGAISKLRFPEAHTSLGVHAPDSSRDKIETAHACTTTNDEPHAYHPLLEKKKKDYIE